MFQKVTHTNYPLARPTMVWDGKCGFCHYWIIKWKMMTGDVVDYQKYQKVAVKFPDIETVHFKEAVRLVDTNGRVYSGPEAAFASIYLNGKSRFWLTWYEKGGLFSKFMDVAYQWVADHRDFLFRLSKKMWGENPARPIHYWKRYLLIFFIAVFVLLALLIS